MGKIEELIEKNTEYKKIFGLKVEKTKLQHRIDINNKEIEILNNSMINGFVSTDLPDGEHFEGNINATENLINKISAENKELESKVQECNEKIEEFNLEMSQKGFEDNIEEEKEKFLENLVFNKHISEIDEEPVEYFQKLIKLYGEEELANYSSQYPKFKENDIYGVYDNSYKQEKNIEIENSNKHDLCNFISGNENELIDVVETIELKTKLLESKIKSLIEYDILSEADVLEYLEETRKNGKDFMQYKDDKGKVDIKNTILNLGKLGINEDKYFYEYLVKHIDERNLPIEKLVNYINPEMVDDEFYETLKSNRETTCNRKKTYSQLLIDLEVKKKKYNDLKKQVANISKILEKYEECISLGDE